jgi:glycosyltransferase involved in cell wall biosynthesis
MAAADLVLCSNERQRDLLLGVALTAGVPLHEKSAVVPYGIDAKLPRRTRKVLRTSGIAAEGDRVALWAGGMWSWFDPLTAIEAMDRLRPSRPELKLAFVGFEHPDPAQRRAHEPVAASAIAYARDRGLEDAVVFRPERLDRDEYFDYLMDADVGISLHGHTLEGRYAARTRILDYLHAGLPVICSRGDTLAEVVAAHGLGRVVEPLDVAGCADALNRLTEGPRQRSEDRSALTPLLWPSAARPLVEYCREPGPPPKRPRLAAVGLAAREYPAFVRSVYRIGGGADLARALIKRTVGRRRRR